MSNPSLEPQWHSPASSVRSTESSALGDNALPPSVPWGPTPITPPALGLRDKGLQDATADAGKPHATNVLLAAQDGEHDGSNVNTPRLLPNTPGKSDLGDIPAGASLYLTTDGPGKSQLSSRSSSLQKNASHSLTDSATLIQHQGPTLTADTSTHRRSGSENEVNFLDQGDQGKVPGLRSTSSARSVGSGSARHLKNTRPRPQDPGMIVMDSTEDKHTSFTPEDLSLSSGRQEAFAENRNRSSSRGSTGRVEKQIEATLSEAEKSSNARSRKSSHIMGLFKENATSSPQTTKGSAAIAKKPSASPSPKSSYSTSLPAKASENPAEPTQRSDTRLVSRSDFLQTSVPESIADTTDQSTSAAELLARRMVSDPITEPAVASEDVPEQPWTHQSREEELPSTKKNLPSKLLEEIRDYHNLAAPVHDKFRSGQPKSLGSRPTYGDAESSRKTKNDATVIQSPLHSEPAGEVSSSPTDDESESEKEHISSALYYPHQAPSPEALQDISIDDARKAKDAQQEVTESLPEPAIPTEASVEGQSDEFDIALQTKNENRYLHGDLHSAKPTSADNDYTRFVESGASSASDSEYDSLDENGQTVAQDDSSVSEDLESTPRASPTTRKSFLHSRSQKTRRVPAAPIGAVELKPFNHQVGGHTKVFRFSKRAVCKQLSNRENVFYEEIEHQHPELLKFMPR